MAIDAKGASTISLDGLFQGTCFFNIPEYQRPYLWDSDKVSDLVNDLYTDWINKVDESFLGLIVLYNNGNIYDIIDGQQRITTLMLLFIYFRSKCTKEFSWLNDKLFTKADKRSEEKKCRLSWSVDKEVQLFLSNELLLKENSCNIDFLQNKLRVDNKSISNMANALITINELFEGEDGYDLTEEELSNFCEYVIEKTNILRLNATTMDSALRLFSSLNDRGTPLSFADILKARIVGAIDNEYRDICASEWIDIEHYFSFLIVISENVRNTNKTGMEIFLSILKPLYYRKYSGLTKQTSLYNVYNESITIMEQQYSDKTLFFETLSKYYSMYKLLIDFENCKLPQEFKEVIVLLKMALRDRNWVAPIFAYYEKFGETDIVEFVKLYEKQLYWIFLTSKAGSLYDSTILKNINIILLNNSTNEVINIIKTNFLYIEKDKLDENLKGNFNGKNLKDVYTLLRFEYLKGTSLYVKLSNKQPKDLFKIAIIPTTRDKYLRSKHKNNFLDEDFRVYSKMISNFLLIIKPDLDNNATKSEIESFNSLKTSTQFVQLKTHLLPLQKYIFLYNTAPIYNASDWNIGTANERFMSISNAILDDYMEYIKTSELNKIMEINAAANYTKTKPLSFTIEGSKYYVENWKDLIVKTCNYLYMKNSLLFNNIVESEKYKGVTRKYFSFTTDGMTAPMKMKEVNIFIETNHDTNGIIKLVIGLLNDYNIRTANYIIQLK